MINNMHYHLLAWERMVVELGGDLKGEALLAQLYGSNKGVVERIFGVGKFDDKKVKYIGDTKEAYYRELYQPYIQLIDGLQDFLVACKTQQIPLALGTASNMPNINLVLDTLDIRHYFSAIISADDVQEGKPSPETFLKAAAQLNIAPADCVVIEDVTKGVQAAANAGMKCFVITTTHTEEEFSGFSNILRFIPDYRNISPSIVLA